jgi:hypothetical protein
MALEQLRQQEEDLRERMVYAGRPGMWGDWLKFQAQAARQRREAKDAAIREAIKRSLMRGLSVPAAIMVAPVAYGWSAELDAVAKPRATTAPSTTVSNTKPGVRVGRNRAVSTVT